MEAETWVNMANFVLAIVLGLTIGFVGKRRKVKAIWRLASACCLVAGLFGFFANMTATDRWTCHFDGRGPMIVGVTLTAEGTDYLRSHPKASCSRMIQDFAGSNVTIWDPIEISTRHAILVALFLATVLAFSLSAVFMLESLRSPARVRRIP
jgi:energy-coupling factor transporter transmembrane protein EcfT